MPKAIHSQRDVVGCCLLFSDIQTDCTNGKSLYAHAAWQRQLKEEINVLKMVSFTHIIALFSSEYASIPS